mmetsp:Transcript_76306/g.205013  ORF Transcript_76306/g.205013 Transcript_76306/m.205013 type:complete len:89 (-) Transcript_76306:219-485(-)
MVEMRRLLFFLCFTFPAVLGQGNLHFASISWARNTSLGTYAVTYSIKAIWNRQYPNIYFCGGQQVTLAANQVPTCATALGYEVNSVDG